MILEFNAIYFIHLLKLATIILVIHFSYLLKCLEYSEAGLHLGKFKASKSYFVAKTFRGI